MMKLRLSFKARGCGFVLLATAVCAFLTGPLFAQDTNAPKTILETLEAQAGVILVKGSMVMGSVSGQNGLVSVKCRETKDAATGHKESGLAIEVRDGGTQSDTTILDYDEVDAFLNAIDFISKADYRVTTLPLFDVVYMTKGGMRLATYSSTRTPGTIQVALQSEHLIRTRVLLSPQQLAQFFTLVQQSKAKLDALRAGK